MLSLSQIGLPEEFEELRNVVFTEQRTGKFAVSSKIVKFPPEKIAELNAQNRANFAAARKAGLPLPPTLPQYYWVDTVKQESKINFYADFGLNRAYALIYSFGMKYLGKIDGKFSFESSNSDFLWADGKRYDYKGVFQIYKDSSGKWIEKTVDNLPKLFLYRGENKYRSLEEIAGLTGKTVEEVREVMSPAIVGEEKDPTKNMCNIFARISRDGDKYTQQVYLNGLPEEELPIGGLIAPWPPFRSGHSYVGRWLVYNDSAKGTGASPGSMSSGNFGQSYRGQFSRGTPQYKSINVVPVAQDNQYDANTHTVTYHPDRENCVVEFHIEFLPAQGKQWQCEAYYDVKVNKVLRNIVGRKVYE